MGRGDRTTDQPGDDAPGLAPLESLLQKKSCYAAERDEQKRQAFQEEIATIAPSDLVFLDEAGFSLSLCLLYGWGKRGKPLVQSVPARRGKNLSVLGAIDQEGVVACTSKEGAMKRTDVERFFKRDLLPALLPGSVIVLDNASIHKGGNIQKIVERAGCRLLYLPPYSPDLNPIEPVWSVVKRKLRREGPRDDQSRLSSVQRGMDAVTPKLAQDCFRHCGYCQ